MAKACNATKWAILVLIVGAGLAWTLYKELEVEATAEDAGEGGALGGTRAEAQDGVLRDESVGYSPRCDTWRPSCPTDHAARHVYLGRDLRKAS